MLNYRFTIFRAILYHKMVYIIMQIFFYDNMYQGSKDDYFRDINEVSVIYSTVNQDPGHDRS